MDIDCSGHGECNPETHTCTCHPGWQGDGCELYDCPGTPDCFDRGDCTLLPTNEHVPVCLDCEAVSLTNFIRIFIK